MLFLFGVPFFFVTGGVVVLLILELCNFPGREVVLYLGSCCVAVGDFAFKAFVENLKIFFFVAFGSCSSSLRPVPMPPGVHYDILVSRVPSCWIFEKFLHSFSLLGNQDGRSSFLILLTELNFPRVLWLVNFLEEDRSVSTGFFFDWLEGRLFLIVSVESFSIKLLVVRKLHSRCFFWRIWGFFLIDWSVFSS